MKRFSYILKICISILAPFGIFLTPFFAHASSVKGHLDNPGTNYENFKVRGWACQTGRNDSLKVHIYLDGAAGTGKAYKSIIANNSSEQGVANACSNSYNKNRFNYAMSLSDVYKYRGKTIYAHGISTIKTGNNLLGNSGKFKVPNVPDSAVNGYIDVLSKSGSDYYVRGWACQTNYKTSINVHVYAGGKAGDGGTHVATGKADRTSGTGVANACKTNGSQYGFRVKIPADKVNQFAGKKIYVHGISFVGTGNSLISRSGNFSLPALPPKTPPSINVPPFDNDGAFTVSWKDSAGNPTGYRLEQQKNNGSWSEIYSGVKRSKSVTGLDAGTYRYRVRACNSGGCSTFATSGSVHLTYVKGHLDNPGTNYENFKIRGWACQTGRNDSLKVHIYLDGAAGTGKAYKSIIANNSSEQGVANACSNSYNKNRFNYAMSLSDVYKYRGKTIYAHGISTIKTGNNLLGNSGKFKVPNVPDSAVNGYIDVLSKSGSDYYVRGWACQTNYKTSIDVHVYAGGKAGDGGTHVATGKADRTSGTGVANACKTNGTQYGFRVKIPADKVNQFAGKKIYVHGISFVGTGNSLIGQSGKFSLPGKIYTSRRVVYVHTDLLGNPAVETDEQGNAQ